MLLQKKIKVSPRTHTETGITVTLKKNNNNNNAKEVLWTYENAEWKFYAEVVWESTWRVK